MNTSSLLGVFIFSFTVGLGAVISPGPVSAAIVAQAPRRGWLVGPLVASGHSVLELLILALVALGLSSGMANSSIQTVIFLLGGALLVYMGLALGLGAWKNSLHLPGQAEETGSLSSRRLVGLGMVATISNPFWYAWWVTAVPGYLVQAQALGLAAVTTFYVGHISADFAWDTFLSAVVGGGRRWMTERIYRGLVLVCAGFLVYYGVGLLVRGLTLIL